MQDNLGIKERMIVSGQSTTERKYWLEVLSEEFEKSCFYPDYNISKPGEFKSAEVKTTLSGELFPGIMTLSKGSDSRSFMILAAGLIGLLYKYTGNRDIVVGIPIYKQEQEGTFINTIIPIRAYLDNKIAFKELLLQVRERIIQGYKHQNYPIETLLYEMEVPFYQDEFPLFDIAVLMENIHYKKYIRHTNPRMCFSFLKTDKEIEMTVEYHSSLYNKETVERIIFHYTALLQEMLSGVDRPLSLLNMMPGEEKEKILVEFNRNRMKDFPGAGKSIDDVTIREYFEKQVEKSPASTALAVWGEKAGERKQITYRLLNEKANRVGQRLRKKGVRPDTLVAVMVESSIELVVGILSVLKSGGAYMPLDPGTPPQRIRLILEDSAAGLFIARGSGGEKMKYHDETLYLEDETLYQGEAPGLETINTPTDLAYVIYTSGSTGTPKGVLIEHRSLLNYVTWRLKEYNQTWKDTCLQLLSVSFDGYCANLFPTLLSGGKLVMVDENKSKDIDYVKKVIQAEQVTTFSLTPLWYKSIMEEVKAGDLKSLKFVVIGGDRASGDIIRQSRQKAPHITLINEYGPTENTVTTTANCGMTPENISIIGKSITDNYIFIMDSQQQLTPIGVPGELCVTGGGLARGYLNNPELTAEKFIMPSATRNPFEKGFLDLPKLLINHHSPLTPHFSPFTFHLSPFTPNHSPIYKTGDLARWHPGGNIELLGRLDSQVKIKGYRIELSEIENRLKKYKKIKDAVVTQNEDPAGKKYLHAYLVPAVGEQLNAPEILEFLSMSLPEYMVPAHISQLPDMPLTPHGKIDRRKISTLPGIKRIDAGDEYVMPRNQIEKELAGIWCKMLDLKDISVKSNFFTSGGDSIKSISLLNLINERYRVKLEMVDLYQNNTIENLALLLEKESKGSPADPHQTDGEYREVLEEIKKLKDNYLRELETKENNGIEANIEDVYPMSDIQKGMLYYSLKKPGVYYNQMIFQLKFRDFDPVIFKRATELLVEKHPILRTNFNMLDFKEPLQLVFKTISSDIEHRDISQMEKSEQEKYVKSLLTRDREKLFNTNVHGPLWRLKTFALGNDNLCFVWIIHHAIIDGWSNASLMTELNNTYLGLKAKPQVTPLVPGKLKSTYKDFVIEQMVENRKTETIEYWKNKLRDYKRLDLSSLVLDSKHPGPDRIKWYTYNLGEPMLEKLTTAARKYSTTVKNLCFGAYVYMLSMLSYENDILVGLVSNSRPLCEDGDKIIGCFLNTVPVRINIPTHICWEDYIRLIERELLELKKYERMSLFRVLRVVEDTMATENPLFDTIFNFVDFHIYSQLEPGTGIEYDNETGGEGRLSLQSYGITNTLLDMNIDTTAGNFRLSFSFNNFILREEWAIKLYNYFEKVLDKFINEAGSRIDKNDIIPGQEKRDILFTFNDTAAEYPRDKTLQRLLEEQAGRTPDHIALHGSGAFRADLDAIGAIVAPGDCAARPVRLTYRELNERSGQLAYQLIEQGVRADTIVGIKVERSVEMIIGIMGILKSGGAYLPIDPNYPKNRIDYMLKDSGAKVLVTNNNIEGEKVRRWEGEKVLLEEIPGALKNSTHPLTFLPSYLQISSNLTHPTHLTQPTHQNLAYVIYTSGSTGKPKGIMVEHRSVINFIAGITAVIPFRESDRILSLTSMAFDIFGLEILVPFSQGSGVVLGSREEQLDPAAASIIIRRENISIFQVTPSRLQMMISLSGTETSLGLLEFLLVGGEAFPGLLLEKVRQLMHGKIYNMYGPTETTIWSTLKDLSGSGALNIGKPIANTQVYIVDGEGKLQPLGVVGELCIGGDGLARGYSNRPGLTAEKFIMPSATRNPFEKGFLDLPKLLINHPSPLTFHLSPFTSHLSPLYKTGDLAKWLPDGNIEFIGRIDHQVKIRGVRVEMGEIENRLSHLPGIKEAVVEAREDENGDKYLCAYVVPGKEMDVPGIRETLSKYLPDHMIPSYFVPLEKIPLTPNGKLDRKSLPAPVKSGIEGNGYIAPRDEVERELVEIWSAVLNINQGVIDINSNFFRLGGHSLNVALLASRISTRMEVTVPFAQVFKTPSIKELSGYIKAARKENPAVLTPVEKKEYYRLSSSQMRMFILNENQFIGITYNLPFVLIVEGEVNIRDLPRLFKQLIARHDSFRTSFELREGVPVQRIHEHADFEIDYRETQESRLKELVESLIVPFDLGKAPLLRVSMIKLTGPRYAMILDMHHIISDGVSTAVLIRELNRLYQGEELPPLPLQYKDYAEWNSKSFESGQMKSQENYWLNCFRNDIPVLDIEPDFLGETIEVRGFEGSSTAIESGAGLYRRLKTLARDNETTLFNVLLAAVNILLAKLSEQEDIVVGTPISGRNLPGIENLIGMFVNTLPIRNFPRADQSFAGFLQEVKENVTKAYQNQDYPFEEIVNKLKIPRQQGRNPLFDVLFVSENVGPFQAEIKGLTFSPNPEFENRNSHLDLVFYITESVKTIHIKLEYSTRRYKKSTAEELLKHYVEILDQVAGERDVVLKDIDISYNLVPAKSTILNHAQIEF